MLIAVVVVVEVVVVEVELVEIKLAVVEVVEVLGLDVVDDTEELEFDAGADAAMGKVGVAGVG